VTALVLAWWLAQAAPAIEGDSACPTAAQVGEHLAQLAGPEPKAIPNQRPLRAYLSASEKRVNVELLDQGGALLTERHRRSKERWSW
jgi:hypothetical protein